MDLQRATLTTSDPEIALRRELAPGERILWSGQPRGRFLGRFRIWGFAIPWTIFAFLWTGLASLFGLGRDSGQPLGSVMPLFGLPFILVGFWMLAQPFLLGARASRTIYAVTDARLIRLSAGRRLHVETVRFDDILSVDAEERRDGTGDLSLKIARGGAGSIADLFVMERIPDVGRARRLIAERQLHR